MTQVLLGLGDKKTVTTNRISTNAVGIAVAIVLALMPPALYGGNPKYARVVLEEERSFIIKCLQLLLKLPQSAESQAKSASSIEDEIQKIRTEDKTKTAKLLEEANDFYSDSAKLRSIHFLTVDPKLKKSLDTLQVVGSWIFVTFGYALQTLKNKEYGKQFLEDEKSRNQLEGMLQELQTGTGHVNFERMTIQDEEGGSSASTKSAVFLNCVNVSIQKLEQVELELQTIKYGICS